MRVLEGKKKVKYSQINAERYKNFTSQMIYAMQGISNRKYQELQKVLFIRLRKNRRQDIYWLLEKTRCDVFRFPVRARTMTHNM